MVQSTSANSRMKRRTVKAELFIPIMTNFKAFLRMVIAHKAESSTTTETTTKDNLLKVFTTGLACSSANSSSRRECSGMASSPTAK